jgi:hypothetical protein
MGVDHCRLDALVTQQLLHGPDVIAVQEQMGGEGVPQSVSPFTFPHCDLVVRQRRPCPDIAALQAASPGPAWYPGRCPRLKDHDPLGRPDSEAEAHQLVLERNYHQAQKLEAARKLQIALEMDAGRRTLCPSGSKTVLPEERSARSLRSPALLRRQEASRRWPLPRTPR